MAIHKLTSTDAFVAFDLDGAPAAGIVRAAPKILQGGAKDLARSMTYTFATLEMQRGGASAGINAQPDDRAAAIAAFASELTPMAADGALALDAGKGVATDQLAELNAADDRSDLASQAHGDDTLGAHLAGLGPVVAAAAAVGGLDGKKIAIEGFGATGPALAAAAAAQGATIVAISTTKGSKSDAGGLDPAELSGAWAESGDAMLGDDADAAWKVFGAEADILFAGSKAGAINHETAGRLGASAVVPHGALPFTARALAVMQRADITLVPDFISLAAPAVAAWPGDASDADAVIAKATNAIESAISETLSHDDGAFLGACYRAEAFLSTWQESLPFGRPLAS